MIKSVLVLCHVFAHLCAIFAGKNKPLLFKLFCEKKTSSNKKLTIMGTLDRLGKALEFYEQENPHYLFQRCLPIMLDMETDKVPFLQCDIHLDELIDEVLLMPNNLHEISPGMFALWIALRMRFESLWSWYTFLEPDPTEECIAADINGVRDLLSKFITVRKEDLIMTGRTFGECLDEKECEE